MLYTIIRVVTTLASSLMMLYFARPKLLSFPVSVKSFTSFGEFLHIDGTLYMYFTGILELVAGLTLLASIIPFNQKLQMTLSGFGYLLLAATMTGALITEFFIRVQPVGFLVKIAVFFLLIAIIQLTVLWLRPFKP